MALETLTLHTSHFDVCAVILISFSSEANAATADEAIEDGIGFQVSSVGSINAPYITISPKYASVSTVATMEVTVGEATTLHLSAFGIYQDRYLSKQLDPAVGQVVGGVVQGITITPSIDTDNSSDIVTETFLVFHKSAFDVCANIIIPAGSLTAYAHEVPYETLPVIILDVSMISSLDAEALIGQIALFPSVDIQPRTDITVREVVLGIKTIQFGSLVFQCAYRDGDDKITPLTDSKLAEAGISEPRAFSRTITISAETTRMREHCNLLDMVGQKLVLSVYGIRFEGAYISSISDLHVKPMLTRFKYTVEFTHYVYATEDIVTFAGISLSHPNRSAPDDISPSFSGNGSASYTLSNLVAKIEKTFTFECIAETEKEYNTVVSLIGVKQPLVINGKTTKNAYISALSSLQPRGGGDIYLYTVEFTAIEGDTPIRVHFSGVELPNASHQGDDIEILSSRTTLHSGKIAADIGTVPARAVSFSCMSNSKADYDAIYAKIGIKAVLYIDYVSGAWSTTIPKSYISELSGVRTCGSGVNRLYTWDISFEEETA